jgi:F-box protein 11
LSYARADDDHDRGNLSEFGKRLRGEVQAQTGNPFHIFQDRNDIAWGQNWRERVHDWIDAGTFFICILTPCFFKSHACRHELEHFIASEKESGRTNMILPVLYIDCPVLDDPFKRDADPLAKLISTRDRVDWRELRFEPLDSPGARRKMASLAIDIRQALESQRAEELLDAGGQKLARPSRNASDNRRLKVTGRASMKGGLATQSKSPSQAVLEFPDAFPSRSSGMAGAMESQN